MKKFKLICSVTVLLAFGFYSCNNEELNTDTDNQSKDLKYITAEEKEALLAGMSDTTVFSIETDEDFLNLRTVIGDLREQELLSMGYTKIEEDKDLPRTKASVQKYTVKISPNGCPQISDIFKAKFSQKFCDQINVDAVHRIYPSKTYLCNWRDAGTYFNLAANQSGGVLPSPKAALRPSTKNSYATGTAERGYDAYKNAHNQYILDSHMLKIVCEDVKGTTVVIDAQYPYWDSTTGIYEINYAILTR